MEQEVYVMSDKLEPCLFCGSEDVRIAFRDGEEGWFGQCQECFSRGAWSEDRDCAAAKWNRRAASEKLKPCPFCGGKVKYIKCGSFPSTPSEYADWVMIVCPSCGATTEAFADINELDSLWDKRAEPVMDEHGLKSCPNCGGKGRVPVLARGKYKCECSSPDNEGCCHVSPGFSRNKDNAVAAWNRRV